MLSGDRERAGGRAMHGSGRYLLFSIIFHRLHTLEAAVPEAAYLLISTVAVPVTLRTLCPDTADIVRWANFSFLFIWWKKAQDERGRGDTQALSRIWEF